MFGEHPLVASNTDLTTDELDQKYQTLLSRFNTARRMNMDQSVLHQLDLLLSSIEAERERRRAVDDKADGVILDTDPIDIHASRSKRR